MAFHTSNALDFDRAHCIENQITAAELEARAKVKAVQKPAVVDEELLAKFQELDDTIERLRHIGSACPSENED